MSDVFPGAQQARADSINNATVVAEVNAIQAAVMTAIAAGALDTTVTGTAMTTSTTYYNVWQNLEVNRALQVQMDAVIQYFGDKGYTISRILNTETNDSFSWTIQW